MRSRRLSKYGIGSCIGARGNSFEGENTDKLLNLNSTGIFKPHFIQFVQSLLVTNDIDFRVTSVAAADTMCVFFFNLGSACYWKE
jgi:hypothetical protein